MREYTLETAGELRFIYRELACDVCAGVYVVSGVVGPGARGPRSQPARVELVERRGGWPCSCRDVADGSRTGLPEVTP
jgi:hypothetical protein